MTCRLTPCLLTLVASACGAAGAPAASTSLEATTATETTSSPPPASPIVGVWTGSLSGGPLTATARWAFEADGAYSMTGYPSIAEAGRFSTEAAADGTLVLHFLARLRCGPCEAAGPVEPAEDHDVPATLSADGTALSFNGWTFSRGE